MMKHHLRRCGAAAFTMVRCFCHFPHAVSTSPPIGWKCPSPRLYSTNEMNQQLPANLVGVMEQRMKLIEQRSAYLQEQINQTARCLA
ncbi:Os05g0277300 [Oryza sativa Japonica Group]|uniref:Os05g0277300 protein n=1 Tax=Oryza sativa subsp. japonica TaxID=39947 RepID=A0A0P0WK99_ORYSJ|nr:hypothetical protein EE612_028304 [Oryza sativa]BAS93122.1 Os05g0277300 [Oryza sativa Japonica Group]